MAHLLEVSPSGLSRRLELPAKEKILVGRSDRKCDVVVRGPAVSGLHCSLSRRGDAFVLADEGSTNGTSLNGAEVGASPVPVWRGDEIKLGDAAYVLAGEDVPERPAAGAAAPSGPAPAPILPGAPAGIRPLGGTQSAPAAAPAAAPRRAGPLAATAAAAEAAGTAGPIRFDQAGGGGAQKPAAFKRKRSDGPVWIAVIVLGVLVAIGLLVLFVRGMAS